MKRLDAAVLAGTSVLSAQVIGAQSSPAPTQPRTALWYAWLNKPAFTPPGPVFALAWTALDGLLGYAGYRLLLAPRGPKRTIAVGCWALNVLGVGGFSLVLFGRKRLDAATGVSVAMLASSFAGAMAAKEVDRRAAVAGLPLIGWLAFATLLQAEVWRRN